MDQDSTARRRSRRSGATPKEAGTGLDLFARYGHLRNPFPPVVIYSDDEVESLHLTALQLLETLGMRVLSGSVRAIFAAAGAEVNEATQFVRLDRSLVNKALETVQRKFSIRALDPARSVPIGGNHLAFAPVWGPPNFNDLQRGRRAGTMEDLRNFIKLSQSFDVIHMLAPCVEAQDMPLNTRHLDFTQAQLTLADKPLAVYCRGREQIRDCFEMIRIAHGISAEEFATAPCCYTIVNTNSPRQLDIPMGEGIVEFASAGQMVVVTPFTLSGAMAPVTVTGALTLAHMEALLGITLSQLVRPGAPVLYGTFTSNVDMKSGAPAFGTPEYTKACFGAGQLARRIGVPWRSSSANASNTPDAQAAYESQMSLWGAIMAGCNMILHSAGWLEGGLSASSEKFILDIEMLQMFAELFQPLRATADEIAADAITEVEPGGHFFAAAHTMQRYKTAFYPPLVSDRQNYGLWQENGSLTATQRAAGIWESKLREYEAPRRDPAIVEALDAFSARRRAEGGAAPVT